MFAARRSLTHARVVLTGASSGIGRAVAVELAKRQTRLVLTARRQPQLEELVAEVESCGGQARMVVGDITDGETRDRLFEVASQAFDGVDILINNAGVGGLGAFATADETRLRQIMEVNFFAPAELIRTALPLLRGSQDGLIVNVGSVLGHCAVPKKSEYCASKFALHGLNDALHMELAREHIDVLLVSPSTTSGEFFDKALRSEGEPASNPWAMTPSAVARCVVRAMEHRRREVILSSGGKLLVWADRLFPGFMSGLLSRRG